MKRDERRRARKGKLRGKEKKGSVREEGGRREEAWARESATEAFANTGR